MRTNFFTLGMTEHWNRLPRERIYSSLEMFKPWMLSCVTYCREPVFAGGWTRGSAEIPTPGSLWFCDLVRSRFSSPECLKNNSGIVMVLCYYYFFFSWGGGNLATYCCSGRSYLVFIPTGILFVPIYTFLIQKVLILGGKYKMKHWKSGNIACLDLLCLVILWGKESSSLILV